MSNDWMPRGGVNPDTLTDWWGLANSPLYADSGIQKHLHKLATLGYDRRIVELGMGGGDQSTIAWLWSDPRSLTCYDINEPGSLETIRWLTEKWGPPFTFMHGNTSTLPVTASDVLFVDSWHDAATVYLELQRFAPECKEYIIFHDVVSFGRTGQSGIANTGINLPIAEFLFENPVWRVNYYSTEDNGLLILKRDN